MKAIKWSADGFVAFVNGYNVKVHGAGMFWKWSITKEFDYFFVINGMCETFGDAKATSARVAGALKEYRP